MQKSKFRLLTALVVCSFSAFGHAFTVNRLNGGGSVLYVDFSIPGPVVPLELVRAYNSITAVNEVTGTNGGFGWGWTAPFETSLTVTPERQVLLRDGATGNTVVFRTEKEDPKVREAFYAKIKKAYFERKLNKKLDDDFVAKKQLPENLLLKLKNDPQFRVELAIKYEIAGTIPRDELLVSSEFGYQTMQFRDNQWIRENNGVLQYFDKEGRLAKQKDKNGYLFEFKYSPSQRMQITEINSQDRVSTLKFTWRKERIAEVIDNRGRRAKYTYDGLGNLIQVVDSRASVTGFRYEDKKHPHLLTRIDFLTEGSPDKKVYREIRYEENGLVVFLRDRDGAELSYTYGKRPTDPDNNFWTKSVRKPASGGAEEQYDEFFIKSRTDGSKYLYKQETKNAAGTMVTIFAPCCAKPTQITKNGEVTNFKYYDNGLLSEKVSPKEDIRLEYDLRWKKVSKVNQNGVVSSFQYDNRGNLVVASNTKAQKISLKYDRFGRIQQMTDPEGRDINFKYGDQGKPTLISEKGVGTIRIQYDKDGKITKTETLIAREKGRKPSETASQEVVRRVMHSFQQMLDILRPAGVNLTAA